MQGMSLVVVCVLHPPELIPHIIQALTHPVAADPISPVQRIKDAYGYQAPGLFAFGALLCPTPGAPPPPPPTHTFFSVSMCSRERCQRLGTQLSHGTQHHVSLVGLQRFFFGRVKSFPKLF